VNGVAQFKPESHTDIFGATDESGTFKSERFLGGSVSINLPIFTGCSPSRASPPPAPAWCGPRRIATRSGATWRPK
jgi:hypothetical protein